MKKIIGFVFISLMSCAQLERNSEWNNPLDPNGNNYFPPVVNAMDDFTITVNDTFELRASFTDSNGTVDFLIWTTADSLSWKDTVNAENNHIKIFSSNKLGKNRVIVYAIDDDGIVSKPDSLTITVLSSPPTVSRIPDLLVSQDSIVIISVDAIDTNKNGTIEQYYLDVGLDGLDDSSSDKSFSLSKSEGGIEKYCVGVRDDDTNMVFDTFSIRYNRPPSNLYIEGFNSGDTIYYENVNLLDLNGSVQFFINADDPDSSMDILTYKFYIWLNDEEPSLVYEGIQKNILLNSLLMAQKYKYKLIVSDIYGDSLADDGVFYTELIDLVNPVITLKGDNPLELPKGFSYKEPGFEGYDQIDGDISDSVEISGDIVNTSEIGSYEVVYTLKDEAGNDTSVTRIINVNNYVTVENFDGGKSWQTTFGALFEDSDSTGYWKAWSDFYEGGNTAILPDLNLGTDSAFKNNLVSDVTSGGGSALNLSVSVGEDAYYPYWGVGFFIRNRGEYYDLSGLDSLVFYVKGSIASDSGFYRIQFTYQALDSLWEDSKWGYVGKGLALTNEWQKVVLKPADLTGVEGSPGDGHTWDMIKHGINMIQFCEQPGEEDVPDVELYIDDIRMYGDFRGSGLFD